MFAAIKNLIPEPRQANQPRNYVGRHRKPEMPTGPGPVDKPAETAETAAA
ncbi:hypothetical protein GCM10010172_54630 [Paractinoplanes ferrugineus]|uniref:Uncharacterized protein n=1 Tax=Paractinoplanes ferrugineus TaxID=113564 RepID=A0A919MEI4_9ACTN|nr:hypothetical protein [Actinoplanes ferrugineus]GIE11719.1 hypothetical protein Afe05nite_35590 [Actinoplanes ferrugineus]